MKVLGAQIRWWLGWACPPGVRFLVDKLPLGSDYTYSFVHDEGSVVKDHGLYWAESHGIVHMYSYRGPDRGFAGRSFHLNMDDGSLKTLIGPWDCGSSYGNRYFPHSMEVSYIDKEWWDKQSYNRPNDPVDPKAWNRTLYGGYALVSLVQEILDEFCPYATVHAGEGPAGKGTSSGAQTAIINHGGGKPYGGLAPKYVVGCQDGRPKLRYSEVLAAFDDPGATDAFMKNLDELGLYSEEEQEEFYGWYRPFAKAYKAENQVEKRGWGYVKDTTYLVDPPYVEVRAAAVKEWKEKSHE